MIDLVTAVNERIRLGNISAIFSPVSDESFLLGTEYRLDSKTLYGWLPFVTFKYKPGYISCDLL